EHDAVPFGFFLALPGLVVPDLGRSHVERRDRSAARRIAKFGIATEIAHKNDLVHTAHRGVLVERVVDSSGIAASSRTLARPTRKETQGHWTHSFWCRGASGDGRATEPRSAFRGRRGDGLEVD